jgi:hypothetical protein
MAREGGGGGGGLVQDVHKEHRPRKAGAKVRYETLTWI